MRRDFRTGIRLKHLNASGRWPSGNTRYYFRPHGQKGVPLPDYPKDHPQFLAAYAAAAGTAPGKLPEHHRTGSLGAAVRAYEASDHFLSLAPSTREVWRRALADIRTRYGKARLADLRAKHIRQDLARLGGHPANNRRKIWRAMGRFWVDAGMLDEDPAAPVRARSTPRTGGHTAWTREDVEAFRQRWPHDTSQRLAMELMHRTCCSIGDACRLGPQMVKDGWLTYKRQKSGSEAVCPMGDAPAWFEGDDHLQRCLDLAPRHLTYMVTAGGHPRSVKAASQWFAKACRAAGLDADKTAHGIRKHRASVFKENGASPEQRMAVLGHETQGEAHRYSKSADLQRVVTGAFVTAPGEASRTKRG